MPIRVTPATCWGGPFDGRTIEPSYDLKVYCGRNGIVGIGIKFLAGRCIGEYVREVGNSSRLIWTERNSEVSP